jgi:O-antigen ligase
MRATATASWTGAPEPGSRWDLLQVAVALAILTSVWRIQDLWPILARAQVPTIASLAAYGAYIVDRDPRRRLNRVRHPIIGLATAILILMVLSVPGGVYPGLSFMFILKDHLRTFLMLVLIAASIRSRADVERFAVVQLVGAVMYSVVVMTRIQISQGGRLGELYFYDANDLGMMIVATVPAAIFFLRQEEPVSRRLIALAAVGILILALLRTGSRGGFVGLLGVVGYLVWRFRAVPRRVRFTAVAAMLLLMTAFASDQYWKSMQTLLNPTQDYNWSGKGEEGRMEVWKRGMGYMVDHPFFGVGANAFPAAEGMISPLAQRQDIGIGLKWSAAHNSFVQIGAELGVGGLVLFLVLLVRAGRSLGAISSLPRGPRGRALPEAGLAQTLGAALVGYCIAGFFLSQAYSAFLYSMLGIIVGLAKVAPVPSQVWQAWVPRVATRPGVTRPASGPFS